MRVAALLLLAVAPSASAGESPFAVAGLTTPEVRAAFDAVRDAVRRDDPAALAQLVQFPLTTEGNGCRRLELKSASDLVAHWQEIATPAWRDAVLEQDFAQLFANWRGVMFGSGEAWLAGICDDGRCARHVVRLTSLRPPTRVERPGDRELPSIPPPSAPPPWVFGTWTCTRIERTGGSLTPSTEAESVKGHVCDIASDALTCDTPSVASCAGPVEYDFVRRPRSENDVDDQSSLDGVEGLAREDALEWIVVRCGCAPAPSFEVTRNDDLAIYYDGWIFVFTKATPPRGALTPAK